MRINPSPRVLTGLQALCAGGAVAARTDRQLLDRFVDLGDRDAFAALVKQHGGMVLGVCRAILDHPADADDAFQATFLILVRKADSIQDGAQLGPWLHGVARRVALRAGRVAARRRVRERSDPDLAATTAAPPPPSSVEARELAALIHGEIDRLATAERVALTLCDLEGFTHQEAADRLGWPLGTVKSRVTRGRERLRVRLIRRGVTLSAAGLAAALAGNSFAANVALPAALLTATTRAAVAGVSGRIVASGLISLSVSSLTQGVLRTMMLTKLKAAAAALVTASSVVVVPSLIAYQQDSAKPDSGPPTVTAEPKPAGNSPTDPAVPLPVQVATAAVNAIARQDHDGKPVGDDFRFGWYQRLADAEYDAARTKPERLQAIRNLIRRQEAVVVNRTQRIMDWLARHPDKDPADQLWERVWAEASATTPLLKGSQAWLAGAEQTADGKFDPLYKKPEPNMNVEAPAVPVAPMPTRWVRIKPVPADGATNQIILNKLNERISMTFPHETPLSDILRYIEQSTQDEAAGIANGIPIYVDPQGLQDTDKTLASTVSIKLEGVPLRSSLALLLSQLELDYVVEGGLLLITSKDEIENHSTPTQPDPAAPPKPPTDSKPAGPRAAGKP